MSKKIDLRVDLLITRLKGKSKKLQILECKNEVKHLKEHYKIVTVRTYLTKYKKKISLIFPHLIRVLRISNEQQAKIERAYSKSLKKRHGNITNVRNSGEIIETAKRALLSANSYEVAVGIMLLTGRRTTEVLKTAKFLNGRNSLKECIFEGQLKAKGRTGRYKIYTLGDSKKNVKEALKKVRKGIDCKKLTNEETKRKHSGNISRATSRVFGSVIGDDIKPHGLRAMYAAICIREHLEKSQGTGQTSITTNFFISEILGHKDDITTASSYSKYRVLG